MATKPFPILFIAAMDVEGAVASSGLIKRLIDEVPNARFTIVAGPASASLYADVPGLDEIIIAEKTTGKLYLFGLWRRLHRLKWGLIVDTRASGLTDGLIRKRRAVHTPRPGEIVHPVIEAARLLDLETDPPPPFLFASPETEFNAAQQVPVDDRPILVIAPGATWGGRVWPVERFCQTAARLLAPEGPMAGGRLVVMGDHENEEALEATRFSITRQYLTGRPGMLSLLGDYAVLKRARLFIGNDGPWTQLAAAAGAPTLALFGPSDERTAAPWGAHARVVRGPRSFAVFQALDPSFNQAIGHMMDLPIETVLEAAHKLLAETEPAHA